MNFSYDVALSFAGEQREYARQVANSLVSSGLRVFFDEFFEAEIWGKDLGDFLDEVYRKKSRYIIIFVSKEYRDKKWTDHERKSALAAALESENEKVLPIQIDGAELNGIRSTTAYLRAADRSPEEIAGLVIAKIRQSNQSEHRNFVADEFALTLWRLVKPRYIDEAFLGQSAKSFGGRWSPRGNRVVYASSSLALAALELKIHQNTVAEGEYIAIQARFPAKLPVFSIEPGSLPENWKSDVAVTQSLGGDWLKSNLSCILSVPSLVIPAERNLLLNPDHPDFSTLVVVSKETVNLGSQFIK